jgi:hypothetical protein
VEGVLDFWDQHVGLAQDALLRQTDTNQPDETPEMYSKTDHGARSGEMKRRAAPPKALQSTAVRGALHLVLADAIKGGDREGCDGLHRLLQMLSDCERLGLSVTRKCLNDLLHNAALNLPPALPASPESDKLENLFLGFCKHIGVVAGLDRKAIDTLLARCFCYAFEIVCMAPSSPAVTCLRLGKERRYEAVVQVFAIGAESSRQRPTVFSFEELIRAYEMLPAADFPSAQN